MHRDLSRERPSNSIAVGAIAFTEDGNDDLVIKAWKLGIDQVNERRSPDPPLALHICDVGKDENDAFKSMQLWRASDTRLRSSGRRLQAAPLRSKMS